MKKKKVHRLICVSDATGETVTQFTQAALVQFSKEKVSFTLYKNIRTVEQAEAICDEAGVNKDLIIYTIVSPELRATLHQKCKERMIPCVDLLGPLLLGLANHFGHDPDSIAGLLHDVSERYFRRIDAMEYTIQHDDGRDTTGLDQADIVILGVSRTSKTPLSMYLSHLGWKVANIPLIRDFKIPEDLFKIDQKRIIALTIQASALANIRRARLQRLGQAAGGEYADLIHVQDEIEYANDLFRKNRRWAVFDVTGKALEETASEIIKLMTSRGLAPPFSLGSSSTTPLQEPVTNDNTNPKSKPKNKKK